MYMYTLKYTHFGALVTVIDGGDFNKLLINKIQKLHRKITTNVYKIKS